MIITRIPHFIVLGCGAQVADQLETFARCQAADRLSNAEVFQHFQHAQWQTPWAQPSSCEKKEEVSYTSAENTASWKVSWTQNSAPEVGCSVQSIFKLGFSENPRKTTESGGLPVQSVPIALINLYLHPFYAL